MKREYPNQPILGVGAVILKDYKIVLVKRGVEPALGKWSIPGGAVDLGEAVREAVKREAKEECGLDIELIDDARAIRRTHVVTYEISWIHDELSFRNDF